MKRLISLLTVSAALLLTACGGGGGCAGTPTNGTNTCTSSSAGTGGTTTPTPSTPTASQINLVITDSAGATLPIFSISSGVIYYAQATVVDATGAPLANQIVSFTTDNTIGSLAQATALTNASGVAKVQISPASLTTVGAAILTATSTMPAGTVTASIGYQTGASNVALGAVTATPATINALQTASVSVPVTVGTPGVAATPGQVSVTLTPGCGYFTSTTVPAITVPTGAGGLATATWHSVNTCGGTPSATQTFSASAAGATSSSGSIAVTAIQPANILFTGANATTLVVSSSSSGTKQSILSFEVVDANGGPMPNVSVTFSLDTQSKNARVNFGGGIQTPQVANTDATTGIAQVTIYSSSFPTPVSVTASLTATPAMLASSFGIVVTSGMPSQIHTSLSATKLNLEGFNIDGLTSTLTLRTADRMGNPPPANTAVSFVASYGTIGGSCLTDTNGGCSVTYTTAGTRPADGIATVLAYLVGEESFTDLNGNNIWDSGELYVDMGQAYLDVNHDGSYDVVAKVQDQKIGTAPAGSSACLPAQVPDLSVQNTCDGTWTANIPVRQPIVIGLSSSRASITSPSLSAPPGNSLTVTVADAVTGVGMGFGSSVAATVASTSGCTLSSISPGVVPNQVGPSNQTIFLNNVGCTGGTTTVTVTVTSPSGIKTSALFTI